MDNREKALWISTALKANGGGRWSTEEIIESELNRLDAPEPKKWEPRGGPYTVDLAGDMRVHPIEQSGGRSYPSEFEAERAAPLHRKLDRLVNWLVEHVHEAAFNDNISFGLRNDDELALVIDCPNLIIKKLTREINSGEVEL